MLEKRVLFILQNLEGGGAEKVFVNIANGFVQHGISVDLLLGERKGVYFDLCDPRVNIFELNSNSLIGYIVKLPQIFYKVKYTHVFTASDYITVAVRLVQIFLNYKFHHIGTLHYDLVIALNNLKWPNKIWLRALNKYIIATSNELVSVSQGVAKSFMKAINNQRVSIKTIYNPVFDENLTTLVKEHYKKIHNPTVKLIAVGRLAEQKDYPTLFHAIQELKERNIEVELSIYGIGPLENQLKHYVRELDLDDYIFFKGFTKEIYKEIAMADVFVLSSIYEGLPTVLIEALALGVSVVSTDCPSGPREILENGKFGYLAKVKNPMDLANKIMEAVKKPLPKELLIDHAQNFNVKRVIPQYINLLSK